MPTDNFFQLPADSTGKKVRTVNETVGANDVHTQTTDNIHYPAYLLVTDQVAAANKRFLTILNTSGSGKKVRILRAYAINVQTAAITGGDITVIFSRITARSGGSTLSALALDSGNAAIPAQIQINTGDTAATVDTAPAEFFKIVMSTDETANFRIAAHQMIFDIQQVLNPCNMWVPDHQPVTLPEGKGLMVQQGAEAISAGTLRIVVLFELY